MRKMLLLTMAFGSWIASSALSPREVSAQPIGDAAASDRVAGDPTAAKLAATALVPTGVLFDEDFEIGDLEDAALPRIERIEEYLIRPWDPQIDHYPKYMIPVLERIPGPLGPRGRRYLRYPVRSGDAAIRGASFSLRPWMRLRVTADVSWRGIGAGSFHVGILYSDGTRVPFVSASGPDSDWQTFIGEGVVPTGIEFGRIEIWVDGDHTRNSGEQGVDNIRVEILPRVVLRSNRSVRRVDPIDDRPFTVQSIGFPSGEYDLELIFRDDTDTELLRVAQHKFVRLDRQIEFQPRVLWRSKNLPRGLYTVELRIRSADGWSLSDRGSFVLGGRPVFAYRGAAGRWGLVVDATDAPPVWLEALGTHRDALRYLVEWSASRGAAVPSWIDEVGPHRRSIAFAVGDEWTAEQVKSLEPLRHGFPDWYWLGRSGLDKGAAGDTALAAIAADAPYLRTGRRVPLSAVATVAKERPLIDVLAEVDDPRALAGFDPGRASFDVLIDGAKLGGRAEAASDLATALYLSAIPEPQTVYLDGADELFVVTLPTGDVVPQPTMLAWEFVSGFLSGAQFESFEEMAGGTFAVFRRTEDESAAATRHLLAIGDGSVSFVDLYSRTGITVYGPMGDETQLVPDDQGRVAVRLSREPKLLAGVDLEKWRTDRSVVARRRPGASKAKPNLVPIELSLTNHYASELRVAPRVEIPKNWQLRDDRGIPITGLPPREVAPGATVGWTVDVEVPPWFVADEKTALPTQFVLELPTRTDQIDKSIPVPVAPKRLTITPVGLDGDRARVRIENTSGEPLRLSVFLELEPIGRGRTYPARHLGVGESRTYGIARGIGQGEEKQLFVGVVVEDDGQQISRVFDLP